MPRNVVLIGFMGSGKSATARALATRLSFEVADTDEMVEAAAGRSIEVIFKDDGEAAFREREAVAVAEAARGDRLVIACGGGAILSLRNLTALQQAGPIVYLRAKPETLIERVGAGEGRPLLDGDPKTVVPKLLADREPAYRSAADLIVDVDELDPDHVAAAIVERLP